MISFSYIKAAGTLEAEDIWSLMKHYLRDVRINLRTHATKQLFKDGVKYFGDLFLLY